jgi:8-oxo-dGTP diphosphatase
MTKGVCLKFSNLTNAQFIFLEPPKGFNPKVEVAGCFVAVGNYFLFLKQQPHDSEPNAWGVPGGKIRKTENAESCSVREVYEETGIDLAGTPPRFLGKVYIRYPEIDFVYWMFEARLERYPATVVIDPVEHTEYRWITLREALTLPLIRGEDECIHLIYADGLLEN